MELKRLLIVLFSATLLLLPEYAKGDGTWVLATRFGVDGIPLKPGTYGEKFDLGGFGSYVDIKSIVRKGKLVYFNQGFVFLNHSDSPSRSSKTWNFSSGAPIEIKPGVVDCSTPKVLEDSADRPLKAANDMYYKMLATFACSR